MNNEYYKGKPVYLHHLLSGVNSSYTLLQGYASFEGSYEECVHYNAIKCNIDTDKNGVLYIDFSSDKTNVSVTYSFNISRNIFFYFNQPVRGQFYKIRFENAESTAQTTFTLAISLSTESVEVNLASNIDNKINFHDSMLDAFHRLRVSQPYGIFESKFIYDKSPVAFEDLTNGSGACSYNSSDSSVDLSVGTTSGDYAKRQTYRYFNYISGKGHLIVLTGNFNGRSTNREKNIGYFDDNNGCFYRVTSEGLYAVIRSKTSGTVVDTSIHSDNFNIDRLDGTGPSGINIDLTKAQIIIISFQWLGVGSVTFSFSFNGSIYPVHRINHSNLVNGVYMQTPSLPVRYEIINTGTATGTGTLKQICCSISSEGGYQVPGTQFSDNTNATGRALGASRIPIFAIKLKDSFASKENRKTVKLVNYTSMTVSCNAIVELVHATEISASTATWTSASSTSAVEYSTDISALTASYESIVDSGYVPAGQAHQGSGNISSFDTINVHTVLAQNKASNSSQYFIIYARTLSGTGTIYSTMSWLELD